MMLGMMLHIAHGLQAKSFICSVALIRDVSMPSPKCLTSLEGQTNIHHGFKPSIYARIMVASVMPTAVSVTNTSTKQCRLAP